MNRSVALIVLTLACVAGITACRRANRTVPLEEPIGSAYVGPQTLNVRKDLAGRSAAVGAAHHGERVDILETRRRFVRIRTAAGVEGWTDANLLLTSQQMDGLQKLADRAKALPSEGKAKVFDALNMHPEPSRTSPTFAQIPEGGSVEVVAHRIAPRAAPVAAVRAPAPRRAPARKSKAKEKQALDLPPPPAPKPPSDWEAKSRPRASDLPEYTPPPPPPPVAYDDWNLVRTADGKAGWVLSRMLFMSIPDEVAQYAEGHRITSYMPLGEVKDGDQVRNNWLWTTAAPGPAQPWEFDSFRVFVWSKNHHRYETAYVERNVTGYFPIEAVTVTPEHPSDGDKGFSVVVQEKDGKLYKRTYGFSGFRIRMISKAPFDRGAIDTETEVSALDSPGTFASSGAPQRPGWWTKLKALPKRWFSR